MYFLSSTVPVQKGHSRLYIKVFDICMPIIYNYGALRRAREGSLFSYKLGESGASCNIFKILVFFQVIINFMNEVMLYI